MKWFYCRQKKNSNSFVRLSLDIVGDIGCCAYMSLCSVRLAIFHRLNGLFFGLNYQKNIRIFIMQFTFQKETKKSAHTLKRYTTRHGTYTLFLSYEAKQNKAMPKEKQDNREREKKRTESTVDSSLLNLVARKQQGIYLSHVRDKLALGFFPSTSLSSMHVYSALFI